MKHAIIPWIIAVVMVGYVYGLTYQAKHNLGPNPSYEFYDTTQVKVIINGQTGPHYVYGEYNNILEGQKNLITAKQVEDGVFNMLFEVNSPRPARLYINDEILEVLLMPGDTSLNVNLYYSKTDFSRDSVIYKGLFSNISDYYLEKSELFGGVHLRARRSTLVSQDLSSFGNTLDSMAIRELNYLNEKEIFGNLPEWFVHFERNEILYQKAYLKMAEAYNQEVPPNYLDAVDLNNPNAMFSYYYYLYLESYFTRELSKKQEAPLAAHSTETTRSVIELADNKLLEGPHDVFLTRSIFKQLQDSTKFSFAEEIFWMYEEKFNSKKYMRYLKMQLEELEDARADA